MEAVGGGVIPGQKFGAAEEYLPWPSLRQSKELETQP